MFGTGTFPTGMTYLTFGTFAQLTNGALMTAANAARSIGPDRIRMLANRRLSTPSFLRVVVC